MADAKTPDARAGANGAGKPSRAKAAGTGKARNTRAGHQEQQAALMSLVGLTSGEIAVLTVVKLLEAVYELQASDDPKLWRPD